MSALEVSVTEVALASRCARQFVLSREGLRVHSGEGLGIGRAAHAVLEGFVRRAGRGSSALAGLLDGTAVDEAALGVAVWTELHAEFFGQAVALAPGVQAEALVELGRLSAALGHVFSALLARAFRAGLRGHEALERTFVDTERPLTLTSRSEAVVVRGRLDLLCRDHAFDRLYVWDLKTALTDEAAAEQVRLYALALRREGETARPVLAHVSAGQVRLTPVGLDEDQEARIDARLEALREWVSGEAVPPAAPSPATCRGCLVRNSCWARWGRTLTEGEARRPAPAVVPAGTEVEEEVRKLEGALRARRIPVARFEPSDAQVGPSVLRLRLVLRDGADMRRVERAARDIQRELGWASEPIVSNDGSFLAIDASRRQREQLAFERADLAPDDELRVPVGLGLTGEPVFLDLAQAPHLLVAGTTGSGKTNFLQGMVLALMAKDRRPLVHVVDPKAVDFVAFDGVGLAGPVLTDAAAAHELLRQLVDEELPRRTAFLQEHRARNRAELPPAVPLPAIVVIIDEFADLVAVLPERGARQAFLGSLQRLLQRSRAVGIHLVVATQRPSVDVITGVLKANLPTRIAFRLPSLHDSNTILDEAGAERLLGKGDLLLRPSSGGRVRAQAYAVSAEDVAGGRARSRAQRSA